MLLVAGRELGGWGCFVIELGWSLKQNLTTHLEASGVPAMGLTFKKVVV
jgi:hypothetical protein